MNKGRGGRAAARGRRQPMWSARQHSCRVLPAGAQQPKGAHGGVPVRHARRHLAVPGTPP